VRASGTRQIFFIFENYLCRVPSGPALGKVHVEISGFLASDVTICSKPLQFFTTASTCDNTTHRQVSWFSDFVCILYNLKSHFRQVPRHVTSTRYSRFHVTFWIRPKHTLNIMSINFWMTKVHYSMYLQFKFEISQTIRRNEINLWNISKKVKIAPNFKIEF